MRVLQVAHAFLPESAGGTEVHTHLLSKALQARGHEVAVCYRIFAKERPEHELIEDVYDGIPVYRLVNNFTWVQWPGFEFFCAGLEAKFEAVLDAFRPDIVHFQHLGGGLSTSFPSLVRQRGLPMLLTLHDLWPMCYLSHLLTSDGRLCIGPEGGLRCIQCYAHPAPESKISILRRVRELGIRNSLKLAPRFMFDYLGLREHLSPMAYHTTRLMTRDTYFRYLLQQFDVLLAPSRFLRKKYIDWGIAPERILFLQNGVDPAKFEGLSPELPLGDALQIVYVGSVSRHKGLDVLIDAFNGLSALPLHLHIYGNMESSPETREYAHSLRARKTNPNVVFEGPFPNQQIGRILAQADVVVVPSIVYENCPMAILEALYARRPVVTSNVGGMAELIQDGVNGLTFRVGDADHLAAKMRFLTQNREALRTYQHNITPPRTMQDVVADVEACYRELIAEHSAEG